MAGKQESQPLTEVELIEFSKVNLDTNTIKELLISRLAEKYPERLLGLKTVLDNTLERLELTGTEA